MSAIPILSVKCMQCSAWCHPAEVLRIGESVIQCFQCYEKSREVVESFAEPPSECALCRTSFADLAALTPGKGVSMFPHWMDGTYGFLCRSCDEAYVLKRKDLYGKTRHGWERKIV